MKQLAVYSSKQLLGGWLSIPSLKPLPVLDLFSYSPTESLLLTPAFSNSPLLGLFQQVLLTCLLADKSKQIKTASYLLMKADPLILSQAHLTTTGLVVSLTAGP